MFHRVSSRPANQSTQESQTSNEEKAKEAVSASQETESNSQEEAKSSSVGEKNQEQSAATSQQEREQSQPPRAVSSESGRIRNPYAKPAAANPARPGGYPGSYPGVSYSAPKAAASSAPSPVASKQPERKPEAPSYGGRADRTLTIGAGITMSGEIESCDNLIVEGTVEAALKGARNLDIAESGTFYGTVEIESAVIAGRFEGDLTVTGRLTLRSGAMITGAITYGELEIEAGAIIDGRMTPVLNTPQQEVQSSQQSFAQVRAPSRPSMSSPLRDNAQEESENNNFYESA